MPKTTTTTFEKWLVKVTDDDIFIHQVKLKEGKTLRIVPYELGLGKNTAIGFNGTKETVKTLTGYRTEVSPRLFANTYAEALAMVQQKIDDRAAAVARGLTRVNYLQRLKDGVKYVKEDKPFEVGYTPAED